ncbi:MAG: hypothetical protein NC124_21445 [Clostridium sp.]|nr:hypothetical protein [Clostridium sp.]
MKKMCDCDERIGVEIDSQSLFLKLKKFFETQVDDGIFIEEQVVEPFYVWKRGVIEKKHYASKWYRCKICGCLWEVDYPDFPAKGFVRKYENGIYTGKTVIEYQEIDDV